MAIYSFPKNVIETLTEFAGLEAEQVSELAVFIEENLEGLMSPEATFDKAAQGRFGALGSEQAFRMLDTLVPLVYSVLSTASDAKSAVNDVVRAYGGGRRIAAGSDVKNVERRLRKNIGKLFDGAKVRLKAKAMRLLSSHDKNFMTCEVLSDIRPVFSADGKVRIDAAVFFHTLRIGYGHDRESLSVALDATDLRKLKSAIDRAISKEDSLSDFIARAGVEHVKVS